jgi:Ras family protein T1
MEQLISSFSQIEVSISTSAKHLRAVQAVFYHALKTVLYPKAPLLDSATGRLTTPCVKALLRIFLMCDADGVSGRV